MHVSPRAERFVHLAVDAKAHNRKFAARFNVNVARTRANCLYQQVIHKVDDRATVDHRLNVREVHFRRVGLKLNGGFIKVGSNRVDLKAFLVAAWQSALNATAERKHRPHPEAGDPFHFVEVLEILWVRHRHAQRVADLE
jgi:hypothetical protein